MRGILISHCQTDTSWAETLRTGLARLSVEGAPDFVSLTSGLRDRPLRTEMTSAGALVILLSDEALHDERVMVETGLAVSLGKPVIAVVPGATKPENLDFIRVERWVLGAASKTPDDLSREVYDAAVEAMT